MTPDAQRIAIAEACGWYKHDCGDDLCWKNKHTQKTGPWFDVLPCYLSDLNAMHEAEKVLGCEQWEQFVFWLSHICELGRYHHATASQRAEAFLRALNLYTE